MEELPIRWLGRFCFERKIKVNQISFKRYDNYKTPVKPQEHESKLEIT